MQHRPYYHTRPLGPTLFVLFGKTWKSAIDFCANFTGSGIEHTRVKVEPDTCLVARRFNMAGHKFRTGRDKKTIYHEAARPVFMQLDFCPGEPDLPQKMRCMQQKKEASITFFQNPIARIDISAACGTVRSTRPHSRLKPNALLVVRLPAITWQTLKNKTTLKRLGWTKLWKHTKFRHWSCGQTRSKSSFVTEPQAFWTWSRLQLAKKFLEGIPTKWSMNMALR